MVRCGFSATGRRPHGESGQHGPMSLHQAALRHDPVHKIEPRPTSQLEGNHGLPVTAWMAQLFAERLSSCAGSQRKAAKARTPKPMPARMRAMATTRPKIEICWAM
jgi:hypothetical protein